MFVNPTQTLPQGSPIFTPNVPPLTDAPVVYIPAQTSFPTSLHGFEGYLVMGVSLNGEPFFNRYSATPLPSQSTPPQVHAVGGSPYSPAVAPVRHDKHGSHETSSESQWPLVYVGTPTQSIHAQTNDQENVDVSSNACSTERRQSSSSEGYEESQGESRTETMSSEDGSGDRDNPHWEELLQSQLESSQSGASGPDARKGRSRRFDDALSDPECDIVALSRKNASSGHDGSVPVRASTYAAHELEQSLDMLHQLRLNWTDYELNLKDKRLQVFENIDSCLAWAITFPDKVESLKLAWDRVENHFFLYDRIYLSRLELVLLRQFVSMSGSLKELHFCFDPAECEHVGETVDLFAAFNASTCLQRITIDLPIDAPLEDLKPWLQDLRVPVTLVLQRSKFRMKEVREFARWAESNLPSLAFSIATLGVDYPLDAKSKRALSNMLLALPVTHLELHQPAAGVPLSKAIGRVTTLESLFIWEVPGDVEACRDALRRNSSIKHLSLQLPNHAAKQIFRSLHGSSRLESLQVCHSGFGLLDVEKELAGVVANNTSIKSISLTGFKLVGEYGAELIKAAATNTRLERLSWHSSTEEGSGPLLADVIEQFKGLKKLSLVGGSLLGAVVKKLETNTSVTELDVRFSSDEDFKLLAHLVEKNRILNILRLVTLYESDKIESLVESLASNPSPGEVYGLGEQISESIRLERARLALQSSSNQQEQES